MSGFLIWSIEPWKLLYKSKLWATGQRLHKQELQTWWEQDEKDVGQKPANWLRTGAILPFFARLVNAFTWGELVIRLCGISLPKTWWFRKNTKRFVFKVTGFLPDRGSTTSQQRQHCEDLSYLGLRVRTCPPSPQASWAHTSSHLVTADRLPKVSIYVKVFTVQYFI